MHDIVYDFDKNPEPVLDAGKKAYQIRTHVPNGIRKISANDIEPHKIDPKEGTKSIETTVDSLWGRVLANASVLDYAIEHQLEIDEGMIFVGTLYAIGCTLYAKKSHREKGKLTWRWQAITMGIGVHESIAVLKPR